MKCKICNEEFNASAASFGPNPFNCKKCGTKIQINERWGPGTISLILLCVIESIFLPLTLTLEKKIDGGSFIGITLAIITWIFLDIKLFPRVKFESNLDREKGDNACLQSTEKSKQRVNHALKNHNIASDDF